MENLQPVQGQEIEHMKEAASRTEQSGLSLSERRAFMQLPLLERRQILAGQAEEMFKHYQNSQQWRELQAGDIIDY